MTPPAGLHCRRMRKAARVAPRRPAARAARAPPRQLESFCFDFFGGATVAGSPSTTPSQPNNTRANMCAAALAGVVPRAPLARTWPAPPGNTS
eukprot:22175-Prymnesium_polylepis.1